MDQTSSTPTLTMAQATRVVIDGVNRENNRGNAQAISLVGDAVKLREHNVRKLAVLAEAEGKLTVGFDSYLSYMSNAAGVAAMFEWDVEKFKVWLSENPEIIGLSKAFKVLREAFTEKKEKPAKSGKDKNTETEADPQPLIDVVLSALPHLTADERLLVSLAIIELDSADDDNEEAEQAEAA